MSGSLVVVFPTPHQGGALMLRHDGKEWSFDSAALLSEHAEPQVAYVAFYSNVQHEVLPVQSGHRVPITYNLYFADAENPETTVGVPATMSNEAAFTTQFRALLEDSEFLPTGGFLAFGLHPQYPLKDAQTQRPLSLQSLAYTLKGSDSMIVRACFALCLAVGPRLMYHSEEQYGPTTEVMIHELFEPDRGGVYETPLWKRLRQWRGGWLTSIEGSRWETINVDKGVHWMTDTPKAKQMKLPYMAYGNEPLLAYTYVRLCLLVPVPAFDERQAGSGGSG